MNQTLEKQTMHLLEVGQEVLRTESLALSALAERLDDTFLQACAALRGIAGRVVVSGMGKSGHVGRKIAATLASTGTPAFFMHPSEAHHGDVGMVTSDDALLAISYSGAGAELNSLLPLLRAQGVLTVAMTASAQSGLAQAADYCLAFGSQKECEPLPFVPTTSTTVTLALGDALALSLATSRGFSQHDFAKNHPGGALGRRLSMRVCDLMHAGEGRAMVGADSHLQQALLEMTQKRLGLVVIVDDKERVLGLFTDGDLRRALLSGSDLSTPIERLMQTAPKHIAPDELAWQALVDMEQHKITSLLVTGESQQLLGVIHMHDCLAQGLAV